MPGETVVVNIPFAGGLDEKTAKEYLDPSSHQASVVNGDFVKVGAIDKRAGIKHLSNTLVSGGSLPAITTGTRVVGWSRSSLSILCSTGLYQYVEAPVGGATSGGVVGVSPLPGVSALRRHVTTGDQYAPPTLVDLTYHGQLLRIAVFWDASYNLLATVYDVASGNTILEPTRIYTCTGTLGAGTIPILVSGFDLPGIADGSPRTVLVIQDQVNTSVHFVQYTPSTNTFTAPTTVVAACKVVDAVPYEDDPANGWLVVYDTAAHTAITLAYWTNAGLQTTVTDALSGGEALYFPCYVAGRYGHGVAVHYSTTLAGSWRHFLQWRAGDHAFASDLAFPNQYVTDTLASVNGFCTGLVHLGTDKVLATYYAKASDPSGITSSFRQRFVVLKHIPGSPGTVSLYSSGYCPFGLLPATRPFVVNGEVYQPLYYNLDYQIGAASACQQITLYLCKYYGVSDSMASTFYTTDVCRPVATVAPRVTSHEAQALLDFFGLWHAGLPSNVQRNATRVAVGLKTHADSAVSPTTTAVGGAAWAADFFWDAASAQGLYQASELGSELSLSGGVPLVADGQQAFEDGFFNYPELSYVKLEGGGTPLATGQYGFAVVYRAVDAAGLTHRSAPYTLTPISVTSGAAAPAIYITPPVASYRDSLATSTTIGRVYADIYMTTTNGSALYYKDSIVVSNITSWPVRVRYPATGQVGSVPATTNPLLYTTGGVLDNVNPPASRIQTVHQSRKMVVDETLRQVWPSKAFTAGEAPGFNEDLVVPFPDGGDIAAIASMDGKFIVWKATSIWVMEGEGPTDTGVGSGWQEPALLATDVGALSWQSVVLTPKGLMFQAPSGGIYLLGRDLQVTFIGKNVVDRIAAYPTVVSATLVPSSTQVRFVCADAAGSNNIVIVYDYLLDQWTTHQYAQLSAPIAASCLTYGTSQFSLLTTDGQLWQERAASDANRYMDQDSAGNNHFVTTRITIPYVKAQAQGYQRMKRVQFFGEQRDDCGLQMDLAFNYDDTVKQTAKWSNIQLRPLSIRGQVEAFVAARYNKQMSVQVTISDTAGTSMTTGAGMRFVGAALELQNLGPRYKLLGAAARR